MILLSLLSPASLNLFVYKGGTNDKIFLIILALIVIFLLTNTIIAMIKKT